MIATEEDPEQRLTLVSKDGQEQEQEQGQGTDTR